MSRKLIQRGLRLHIWHAKYLNIRTNSSMPLLLFEVLEHINDPYKVLKEAKKGLKEICAHQVQNCRGCDKLSPKGLTFEHCWRRIT